MILYVILKDNYNRIFLFCNEAIIHTALEPDVKVVVRRIKNPLIEFLH